MVRGHVFIFTCALIFFLSVQTSAQEFPIFDAHVHYNQPDWSVYTPDAILKLFDRAGVIRAMVSSTPDDGTIKLYEKSPTRIVPILRPYRTDADRGSWTKDSSVLTYVEERLKKGIYRGIGEFHMSAGQTSTPVVRGFVQLAIRRGILLYAHTDYTGVEELLRLDPKVQVLWAHAGMSARPETIGQLLDRHAMLSVELSIRDDFAPRGRLDPAWRDLFLRHSDRFLVGSDTWTTSRWENFVEIHAAFRAWLNELSREVAEKLASKNGSRLVGRP